MLRKIIEISEERCNGCGKCADACHEGAIGMVNGKAKLLRDDYCDGLGDCLPARFCSGFGRMYGGGGSLPTAYMADSNQIGAGECSVFPRGRAVDCSRLHSLCIRRFSPQISLRQGGIDWLSKAGYGRLYREADCYFSRKFHQACYGGADASTMLRRSATGGKKCHFIEWTGFSGGSGCHFYRWTDSFVKTLDK